MEQPLITIIIPTYNAAKTLKKAIASIIEQSFTHYEVLVVDGLSKDETVEIARGFNDNRIRIVSEKDNGIYDAMNKGIGLSKGGWLYFLGSDDYLVKNDVFEKVAGVLESKKPDLLYGKVEWGNTGTLYGRKYTDEKLLHSNICHQAMFYKRQVFDDLGNFDPKFKTCADWEFNFRLFDYTKNRIYKNWVIANFCLDGLSNNYYDADIIALLEEKRNQFYNHPVYKLKKKTHNLLSKYRDMLSKEKR